MTTEQMLLIAVSVLASVVTALAGVAVKLYFQGVALGKLIEELNRRLGLCEGFISAVNICPVKGCSFRGNAPEPVQTFQIGKDKKQ